VPAVTQATHGLRRWIVCRALLAYRVVQAWANPYVSGLGEASASEQVRRMT
jgi:hypothetical protein